jgi:acyl-CoA synthetase (NDP forming)/GNAT superfamily N-acetyltransferase
VLSGGDGRVEVPIDAQADPGRDDRPTRPERRADVEGPPGYPEEWEADVVLRDGATAHLRPIRPDDAEAIRDLHGRLSAETIYYRFFTPLSTLSPALLERFVTVDYWDRMALVAELHDQIIAVARYERLASSSGGGDDAEVAFLVDDAHQGRGLGTVLLDHLAATARRAGISRFVADTLPGNARMLRVFSQAGFGAMRTFSDGVVRVVFPIEATETSEAVAFERERAATARSVRRLLAPTTVALIGASRRSDTLGNLVLARLLDGGFCGPVYPVNPAATHVRSVRCYPSVAEIPDRVDLAVVAVPAEAVPAVVEDCVRHHVGALVILSAGFAERGAAGRDLERRIVTDARRNGMRVVGPSSMGLINTDPATSLNATHVPMPQRGRVGLVAQSGALGAVILEELGRRGLGVSSFVSAGNKADVSSNDLLQYWDDDPATDVALLYIESFGNPRSFARIARRVARRKPIVAVKSRRSPAGSSAPGAGQGALEADSKVDALFHRAGVIRTETLEELFDVAQVLATQPLPSGRRVAIVANSGGPGVLAADACAAAGLEVVELSAVTRERLRSALPWLDHDPSRAWPGGTANPVDLPPDARPAQFRAAIEAVLADDRVDAVLALYASPLAAPVPAVTDAMLDAQASVAAKPVLACALGHRGLLPGSRTDQDGVRRSIPSFAFPEPAARALGMVVRYAAWRQRPEGAVPELDVDREGARALVAAALDAASLGGKDPSDAASPVTLDPPECRRLLALYGIRAEPGGPGVGPSTPRLSLRVIPDPLFGPLVELTASDGAGTLRSGSRALPLTDLDARELRDEVVADHHPGVGGLGGTVAVEDVLLRTARLVEDVPGVAALTLDPVELRSGTAVVLDAHVTLARPEPRPERALRRLR